MSQRLNKINRLLKEEISKIIQEELDDRRIGFVTVTKVATSADLHSAKVYISIMEKEKKKEDTLKALNKASIYIKKLLADKVKLRYLPDLNFFEDDSMTESLRIEELLNQIDKQKKERQKNEYSKDNKDN